MPNMGLTQSGLSDALFSRTQQRVLALLFGQAPRSFHLNELVRLAGVGSGSVQRELARLVAATLVHRRLLGRQVWFEANRDSPVFGELRSLARKTFGLTDVLRQALAPLSDRIERAFVFGSVAKGTDTSESDIDLMIIGESLSYADVYSLLTDAEHTLGRKISPTLYSPADWQRRLDEANAFVTRVRHLPTLPIIGPAPGKDDVATAGSAGGPEVRASGSTGNPKADRRRRGLAG